MEPQPSLMLRPSGSTAIASTSAPSRSKIAGAARWVAPLAQSSATLTPAQVEREGGLQRPQVVLEPAVQLPHPAHGTARFRRFRSPGDPLVESASIRASASSSSFVPPAEKNLIPLSR